MRLMKSIATAASLSIAAMCLAAPTQADPWHGYWGDDDYDDVGAAFFGFAAGLIVGGALTPRYHGYNQFYYYRQPNYYRQPYYDNRAYYDAPPILYDASPAYYSQPGYYAQEYYAPYREDPSYRSNR